MMRRGVQLWILLCSALLAGCGDTPAPQRDPADSGPVDPIAQEDVIGRWRGDNGIVVGQVWLLEGGLAIVEDDLDAPAETVWGAWRIEEGAIRVTCLDHDPAEPRASAFRRPGGTVTIWLDVVEGGLHVRKSRFLLKRQGTGDQDVGTQHASEGPSSPLEIPDWAHVAPDQIAEAEKHGVPVAFENGIGMRFVLIPAGTFMMGSPEHEEGRDADEVYHLEVIREPFYMQMTEVTNRAYRHWRPSHQSGSRSGRSLDGEEQPVRGVSYAAAVAFADWIPPLRTPRRYRLPTEAEWEYACRAGTTGPHYWGGSADRADLYENRPTGADAAGASPPDLGCYKTAQVASFLPNPWGLHDMLGNAAEWCADVYVQPAGTPDGVAAIDGGERRVVRSTFCWHARNRFRCASRHHAPVEAEYGNPGFRLVSPLGEVE